MSQLIDKLVTVESKNKVEINGEWWIAKPLCDVSLTARIKDAWRILIGKSQAYHYFEDVIKEEPTIIEAEEEG
jgi:hypothetical protein